MKELNLEYQDLREQLAAREKASARLRRDKAELSLKLDEMEEWEARVAKERKDVDKLEGLSLSALFHTLLSNKTEKLQVERQELLRAQLKWDQCRNHVSRLKADVDQWSGEMQASAGVEAALEEVLRQKEALLVGEDGDYAEQLGVMAEQIADVRTLLRELGEAMAAGSRARKSLQGIIKSLKSAKGWGAYDMLGGGLIATAVKHSHLGEAKGAMEDTVYNLRTFQEELKDVKLDTTVTLELSTFNKFGDFLLDGLIFDWVVQSKIHKSLGSCERAHNSVASILRKLERDISTAKAHAEEMEAARRGLIELA
ncbi:MAG: hypothetical protein JKY61_09145 [Planctomycetes bacterium]|nr:hypothetical protein [Planctomycetota bacterium]